MGLDNGIVIRGKTKKGEEFLKRNFYNLRDSFEYEFGYWRKCWNIRAAFLDDFRNNGYDGQGGYLYLTIDDLKKVCNKTLKQFLDENNWEYEGSTSHIFTWIEELPSIAGAMRNIYIFLEGFYDEKDLNEEDFEIYFYDSY
jgi:hypothetical protein